MEGQRIERTILELLEEIRKHGRVLAYHYPIIITFITAGNNVVVTRMIKDKDTEILFQDGDGDPAELPLYLNTELPLHIIISDKTSSAHAIVEPDNTVHWVN